MKKIITFGLIVLMATFVLAISEGDIFTQEQIDSTDFSSINLNPSWINYEVTKQRIIVKNFAYNPILQKINRETGLNYYQVVSSIDRVSLGEYDDYKYCKTIRTVAECNTYLKVMADIQFKKMYDNIRYSYNDYKTREAIELDI